MLFVKRQPPEEPVLAAARRAHRIMLNPAKPGKVSENQRHPPAPGALH
jgi:hypothetical protein